MKKEKIPYYALIMMILFITYNLVLKNLKIGGLVYQVFMIAVIILNIIILVKYREKIKYAGFIVIIYFLTWLLLSKGALQCLFAISSMVTLIIIHLKKSRFIQVITLLITLFFLLFSMPLSFVYLLIFGTGMDEEAHRNDIYDDMHYYCEDNYEVYSYSGGAMDGFHYSIGKYYEFIHIDDIIYISYNERNEVEEAIYQNYLNTHECKLVEDRNDSK